MGFLENIFGLSGGDQESDSHVPPSRWTPPDKAEKERIRKHKEEEEAKQTDEERDRANRDEPRDGKLW